MFLTLAANLRSQVPPPVTRYALAVAIPGIALVLSVLAGEVAIVLAAIAAVSVLFGRGPDLFAAALATVVVGLQYLTSADGSPAAEVGGSSLRLAIFAGSALAIVLLMRASAHPAGTNTANRAAAAIVENMPGMGWSTDPQGRYIYRNRSVLEYTAGSPEKAAPTDGKRDWSKALQLIHVDDAEETSRRWTEALATGADFETEHRVLRYDGVYRWFRVVARSTRDAEGNITGWYGTSIDIDEGKKAAEALRQSEHQLRLLVDTMPVLVWCTTPEGEPSYINKRLMEYAGIKMEDLDEADRTRLAAAIDAAVHPDDKDMVRQALTHSFSTGEPFATKYRHRRHDGAYRWVDGRAEPLRDGEGRIVRWYGVVNDIDDEQRMQETLRAAQERLARASQAASLAELSASIAHEVNQPLAAIVANSHACQHWLSADPPNIQRATVSAGRIIRDANSAAEVVARIRALFRQSSTARTSMNINDVILEVCQLMADETRKKMIQVATELGSTLPPVSIDRVQMQQVLVNLVRNAVDAMQSVTDQPRVLQVGSTVGEGDTVRVEIRDNGPGLSQPDRMFEPFVTTKEDGMGMGLAICRSIVEAHDGALWAQNVEPRGAQLIFTLPILERGRE